MLQNILISNKCCWTVESWKKVQWFPQKY